jgi:hypothetical protein
MPPNGWPPRTVEILALRTLELANGGGLAAWAVTALEAGFDSPALRKLAGFEEGRGASFWEAIPVFETALQELGVPSLDRKAVLLQYLEVLAEELTRTSDNVDNILGLIHVRIVSPLDHCDEVRPWCLLSDHLDPVTCEEVDEQAIREFARKWLADRQHVS